MMTVLLTCAHLLVALLPVIAALWGMTLVANAYAWVEYRVTVQGARYGGQTSTWIVLQRRGEDLVHDISCEELVLLRYERSL